MKIKKNDRIAQLERRNKELEAQLVFQHHFASKYLDKMGIDRCMGSAVILELTVLGGKETVGPVAIRNGLSPETIAAIRADLVRSYENAIELKPKVQK